MNDNLYLTFDLYGFLYFCVDYSNGIVPRGICGEIGKLIFGNGNVDIPIFIVVVKTACIVLIFTFLISVLVYCYKKNHELAISTAMLFIRPFYFVSKLYVVKPDHFWYLGLVFMIALLWKDSHITVKTICVTVISTICMMFHHAFIFVFAPLICLLLFEKKCYKHMVAYGITMCIEFLLYSFVFTGNYDYVVQHAGDLLMQYGFPDVFLEYTHADHMIMALKCDHQSNRFTQIFTEEILWKQYISYHIPFLVMYLAAGCSSLYVSSRIISSYAKEHKCSWFVLSAFIVPFIFLLLFTVDCDRWALMYLTSMSIFAVYLLSKKKVSIKITESHILMLILAVVFQVIAFFVQFIGFYSFAPSVGV